MNVLITGGTGFIGTRLALRCLERGDQVRVLGQTNNSVEEQNNQHLQEHGVECLVGSVLDIELLGRALEGVDTVFHLAAAQHEMNISDQTFRDVNVEGTRNILELSEMAGIRRFVHGSTIGVYGFLQGTIDEDTPTNPDNIYGVTKLAAEQLVLSYADRLAVTVVRIPEVFGPGDRRLLKLFKAICKNKFFVIGNGENLHHLIYVEDLIDGFFILASKEAAKGEVFLLAGQKPISTKEMAKTIAHSLNVQLPRWRAPIWPFMCVAVLLENTLRPLGIQPPLHRRRMDFFIKGFRLSTAKSQQVVGFVARTDFTEGVRKTAAWYKEQGLLSIVDEGNEPPVEFVRNSESDKLTAKMEPFDSFWEAPSNIEKGYTSFGRFYRENYLPRVPLDKESRILVISCGPGYFVNLLKEEGYVDVLGIDSDPAKIALAKKKSLNCRADSVFAFLEGNECPFDFIFAEQELNHLTKDEMIAFLKLSRENLTQGGRIIVHSLNGANPITGSEALAQNFDHYNSLTEYSLKQVLHHSGFVNVCAFPLNLYVFYTNPLNYVAMFAHSINLLYFRFNFKIYGKANKIFTKKLAAVAYREPLLKQ